MKYLLVTALCWALALSPLFAQKNLPPSAASFQANCSSSVRKMWTAAGYSIPDRKAPSVGHQQVGSRNSDLQLDSTVLFSNYTGASDSTPSVRTTYTYPLPGTVVQTEWYYENDGWVPLNRSTLFYDDQERLVETISEAYEPLAQAYVLNSRLELFPRGISPDLLDSAFVYSWDAVANEWKRLTSILNAFDDQERLKESLNIIDVFGQTMFLKDVYFYDANGDNTLITSFFLDGGLEIPSNQIVQEFENHRVTMVTAMVFDGFDFLPQSRNTYAYTVFGKDSITTSLDWSATVNDWVKTQDIFFQYDSEQRVSLKETRFYEVGGGESREQLAYRYEEGEFVALEETFIWDGGGFYFLTDRKYYYYSGDTPTSVNPSLPLSPLRLYPNPANDFVQISLEQEASVQVFDQTGKLMQNYRAQPGNITVNLTELPAGIYTVHAQAADKFYLGRIVKQ